MICAGAERLRHMRVSVRGRGHNGRQLLSTGTGQIAHTWGDVRLSVGYGHGNRQLLHVFVSVSLVVCAGGGVAACQRGAGGEAAGYAGL